MMLDQRVFERWMAGLAMPGVGFALNEPVVITAGPLTGSIGTVVSLVALDPEPVYTVELGPGRGDVHLPGSALTSA
ncbi:MAG TPA: hypothetical protein VH763_12235 [Gemmatimonadales bacterium]|jgi:hypothetical protein